jgi:hypothetical protein
MESLVLSMACGADGTRDPLSSASSLLYSLARRLSASLPVRQSLISSIP